MNLKSSSESRKIVEQGEVIDIILLARTVCPVEAPSLPSIHARRNVIRFVLPPECRKAPFGIDVATREHGKMHVGG